MVQLFMATFFDLRPQKTSQGGRRRRRLVQQLQKEIPVSVGEGLSVFLGKTDLVLRNYSCFANNPFLFSYGALEQDNRQRRQGHLQGKRPAVGGDGFGLDAAQVAQAAAAVILGVAVYELAPVAAARYAHLIARARHRREVA